VFPWLREHVEMFRGLRVPARFGHLVLLGVAALAGLGLARLRTRVAGRHPALARHLPALAGAALVLEYAMWPMTLVPVQTAPDAVALWLRAQPPGVVADLPLPRVPADLPAESLVSYQSTFHWRPLINGYSGYTPPSYLALWEPLASFPSEDAITLLRGRDVRYVLLREARYGAARFANLVQALGSRCDLTRDGPFADGASTVMVYTLHPPRKGCG
jgi:hypothetical protein